MGNARNLYDERVEAAQERIQEANDQIELLSERLDQLSEGQDAARATVEAQIEAQSQLIVAAQTNLLSLPTASPDAAVLVRSADFPVKPSNKDYLFTGVLAAMLGLALGIGLALIRERLAEPIAGREDFERVLGAQVLAAVPALPTPLYGRTTGPGHRECARESCIAGISGRGGCVASPCPGGLTEGDRTDGAE